MVHLSVNINKIALIRNSREGNKPNLLKVAADCERFGAQGITVHPRPDQRHVRYSDLQPLKDLVTTEFNIEGNPIPEFIKYVLAVRPHQVTLVPDGREQLTSNSGWDTIKHQSFLKEVIQQFREAGIRTSIFLNAEPELVEAAKLCGTDRIELYTEPYAENYPVDPEMAIQPFIAAALKAQALGLGLNAGHDLSPQNLRYFRKNIPGLLEVSIGHALVCDSLYLGLENTIRMYLRELA